jgi:hypothetical protein
MLDNFVFVAGKHYKVTAWIKADAPAAVERAAEGAGPTYYPYGIRQLDATTQWQQVTFEGMADQAANLYLFIPTGVNVYLDDLQILEVTQDELMPFSKTAVVPDTLVGLHVNRLGTHNSWPLVGQGVLRLHNTGTDWCDLQPTSDGVWNASHLLRLDYYVNYAQSGNHAQTKLIYTMGQTPRWLSSNPTRPGDTCTQSGESAPPADLNAWRTYVTFLGNRYNGKNGHGRIQYWEIWNEWDIVTEYSGDVSTMIQMTQIAHDVLKAIDPTNVIIAPSVTARLGTQFVESFLRAGGAQYVDIMSFHAYEPGAPERTLSAVANLRFVMSQNGTSLPLWDTEGGFSCDPLTQPTCVNASTVGLSDLAAPLRHFLMLWDKGVSNFNYYHWEGDTRTSSLVYGLYEQSSLSNCAAFDPNLVNYNPLCPTPLGATFAQAGRWMLGSTLSDAYVMQGVNGRIFVFKLLLGGKLRVIVWSEGADETVNLYPETPNLQGGTWDKLIYVTKLNGQDSKTSIPITSAKSQKYRTVTVGVTPILLTQD